MNVNYPPEYWEIGTMSDFLEAVSPSCLEECKRAGIKCLELFMVGSTINTSAETIIKKYSEDFKIIQNSGLGLWSVHLPFGTAWDISAQNEDKRRHIVEKHFQLIEYAARWGAGNATIHASWEPVKANERSQRFVCAEKSIKAIAQKALECNMRLAVECLPRTCLGNSSGELLQLTACENAFICLDCNHLFSETHRDFIRNAGHKISTLHVSDYDGIDEKHWIPGKGIINWKEVVEELVKVRYKGPFLFEVNRKYKDEICTVYDLADFWKHLCTCLKGYGKNDG